jgi:mono/diheme cytochrome c family protein
VPRHRLAIVAITAIALVVVIAAAGCQAEVAGGKADGAEVFNTICARCHGETGKPPAQMAQALAVRDLTSPQFKQRATLELVKKQVRDGSDNKIMPAFASSLTPAQIDAVAAYVLTLGVPAR